MDDYLKNDGRKLETFAGQLAPAAEKESKIDLILDRIAKDNNFEATDEELSQKNGRSSKNVWNGCSSIRRRIKEK